ncbi:glycosyltransferase family 2 protein [Seonamhaeicola algicola]|uniref:Glycosyltransferase family 2 protein n=1 Tax=Seonamhaeicola algicola TaxID=1719036 RepID=A0A5C7AH08_9FLAO|nr:glycosyltransferase family A protein [Seonamhaeicola algicola]TXE08096.1 glycosyltransferase family 2 protein [Seonamhaeicola algicola]
MLPFFSVVIPLYNKQEYIQETINSVLNQTFQDFEIIVINDGSTDNSLKIIEQIQNNRVKIINQENKGLSAARNVGIKNAKANYIAFLDADDLWCKDFLESIFHLIETYNNEKVFATNFKSFNKKNIPFLKPNNCKKCRNYLVTNYFSTNKNLYASSSLVCNRIVFNTVGYFDETINYGEEEDFAIRCFLRFNLVYNQNIKVYRLDGIKNQLTAPQKNSNRIIPDYEKYYNSYTNYDLKKYVDFIHFKLVVLYKMELNNKLVSFYKKKINTSNLNFTQKIKYYLPTKLFYSIKTFYIWVKSFSH